MSMLIICPGCNWKYPPTYDKYFCKFCKHKIIKPIPERKECSKCHEVKPAADFSIIDKKSRPKLHIHCRACERKRNLQYLKDNPEIEFGIITRKNAARRKKLADMYEEWIETSELAFSVLTESQWLQTCQYFDGCAVCGTENIEARAFFVPFNRGGKYAVWNMFPVCGKCGIKTRDTYNPFSWIKSEQAKKLGLTQDRADKLVDYLLHQIEKVKK